MARSKKEWDGKVTVMVAHPGFDRLLTLEEAEAVRIASEDPENVKREVELAFKNREARLEAAWKAKQEVKKRGRKTKQPKVEETQEVKSDTVSGVELPQIDSSDAGVEEPISL
jgi:predicted GIY-YIG superfamily endonuclease